MSGIDSAFYGITLTGEGHSVTWDSGFQPQSRGHKLVIKQILLDDGAKEDEFNVVEVNSYAENVQLPIAVLKTGEVRVVNPDLEYYESKVTFILAKGSGPVHIYGQTIKDNVKLIYVRGPNRASRCHCPHSSIHF